MKAERDKTTGKFVTQAEPNSRNLTVRVPATLHSELKNVAGAQLAAWIREAIAEKLEREQQQDMSA